MNKKSVRRPSPLETEQQQSITTVQLEPENPDTVAAALPLLYIHTNVVQGLCSLGFICEQWHTPPEQVGVSQDTTALSLSHIHTSCCLGFDCTDNFFDILSTASHISVRQFHQVPILPLLNLHQISH